MAGVARRHARQQGDEHDDQEHLPAAELDAAFAAWLPIRRTQVHRTHQQVIGVRAEVDRAALRPLPADDYAVTDRHLRRVGKDALISFASSRYSVPAAAVRPGMSVELRVGPETIAVHATGPDPVLLALHRRARHKGDDQIDAAHWDGLPDGSTRRTTTEAQDRSPRAAAAGDLEGGLPTMPARAGIAVPVARRDPRVYDHAAGIATPTAVGGAA